MSRLSTLNDQILKVRSQANAIVDAASAEGRDATAEEEAAHSELVARVAKLDAERTAEIEAAEKQDKVDAVLARVSAPAIKVSEKPLSAAEFMTLQFLAKDKGDSEAATVVARVLADQKTSDFGLPATQTAELIKISDPNRPVWNSFTQGEFIPAMAFTTGRVTQRVDVQENNVQKSESVSRKMTVAFDTFNTKTFRGALDIAREVIDLQPASLFQQLVQDFADVYAEETEEAACTYLTSLAAGASSTWTPTNIGTIVSSITTGILAQYTAVKKAPDTLWLALDTFMTLSSSFNTDQSVSAIELINKTLGSAGYSLNVVAGPQLANGTRILGTKSAVTAREKVNGLLSAPVINLHGVDVEYSGYVQFNGDARFFRRLV